MMSNLVKTLRATAPHYQCTKLLNEAADLIEQQQKRIDELEQLTRRLADACAHLEQHNDELSATVERLRSALQTYTEQIVCCGDVDIEYSPEGVPIGQQCCGCGYYEVPKDVVELLSATPQQNLAERDAEVAKKQYFQS